MGRVLKTVLLTLLLSIGLTAQASAATVPAAVTYRLDAPGILASIPDYLQQIVDSIRFTEAAPARIVLYGVAGGIAAVLILGVRVLFRKSRRRRAADDFGAAPSAQEPPPYPPVRMPYEALQYERPSAYSPGRTPEPVLCPNCLSSSWSSETRCSACGATLDTR